MPPKPRFPFLIAAAVAILVLHARSAVPQTADPVIENVRAFAKLYGYVRWFHPSDEASAIDWDRFAIYGVRRVKLARDRGELRRELEALFLPIAPGLQIYPSEQSPPPPPPEFLPADMTGLELVAWQHKGVGFGLTNSSYRSHRLNRTTTLIGMGFGTIRQAVDATPYRGKQVKLIARARAEASKTYRPIHYIQWPRVHLWLRVEGANGPLGFSDIPVTESAWRRYEIVSPIPDDAITIAFGASHAGDSGWFDDFQLVVDDAGDSIPVLIENAGFETSGVDPSPPGWNYTGFSSSFVVMAENAPEGQRAAAIASTGLVETINKPLFDQHPQIGELLNKPLGAGLSVQMPTALFSRNGHTLGPGGQDQAFENLTSALGAIDMSAVTPADEDLRLAGVVIGWNVYQHFYPYFDVVDTDWDSVLTSTLADARDDADAWDFLRTLQKMVAHLDDGHAGVSYASREGRARPPFRVGWVEGRVVVVATGDENLFQVGDVVVSVDGVPAKSIMEDAETHISGSPQWKQDMALRRLFAEGMRGTEVQLELERGGERIDVTAPRIPQPRGYATLQMGTDLRESRLGNVEELQEGIWYVNLGRARMSEISERMDKLAAARGVVFDAREGAGLAGVLAHLTDTPLYSAHWQIPQIIYPDRVNLVGYDTTGRWVIGPRAPRFAGKAVFLISSRAISGSETFMGIVEHYKLGEIVGQPTAGANGNNNPFTIPGGYNFGFTGMRVIKNDGSQHHTVGILPTVPLERTIQALRDGRDEYIERAIQLIRGEP